MQEFNPPPLAPTQPKFPAFYHPSDDPEHGDYASANHPGFSPVEQEVRQESTMQAHVWRSSIEPCSNLWSRTAPAASNPPSFMTSALQDPGPPPPAPTQSNFPSFDHSRCGSECTKHAPASHYKSSNGGAYRQPVDQSSADGGSEARSKTNDRPTK